MTRPNIPMPKSCPFCGYAKVEVSANKKDDTDGHVWCGNDECEADIYAGSRSEAVRRWNNRSIDRENVVLRKCLKDIWDADEMGYLIGDGTRECVKCGEKSDPSTDKLDHAEECVQGWIEKALTPPTTI